MTLKEFLLASRLAKNEHQVKDILKSKRLKIGDFPGPKRVSFLVNPELDVKILSNRSVWLDDNISEAVSILDKTHDSEKPIKTRIIFLFHQDKKPSFWKRLFGGKK